ncbi:homogentisate 1,2-dioxygenase [Kineobactrum sediminis]|uniref:Homogentisate 1,2-dioxygenase n=1 Tax=Kineobactrum sediminis TaxID=1905677 RepID=A0A2N5Y1Y6_9GAMM|nr:homogentisate 1,2-dioxygenase [Kineobactrum sediminis]PLW82406.1 homogentisate 1,2-dioxygenase [Kineobactrum sediminis]
MSANASLPDLMYLNGFGNEHETEALAGALPIGRFSPQRVNYGLYAEQFSSTAFTAPRASNRRSWLYRIRPSVMQGDYEPYVGNHGQLCTGPLAGPVAPNMLRWDPLPIPATDVDFVDGLTTIVTCGDAMAQGGMGIHLYAANQSMGNRFFYCADGEWLLIPQQGALLLRTECGRLLLQPGDIGVIPRGMKFAIDLPAGPVRGYVCENYGAPLILPERGPVGANGFANDRDFQYPVAAYEDVEGDFELLCKFAGNLYRAPIGHSPLDVVAWTGNSAPYKYELARFNVMGSVSYDHPDPSIYTVLTSPSDTAGVANVDFVIFPPRWMVAENTFRPPWYHRNVMSEYMGLIEGIYDAKEEGFLPGGSSLHNSMSPHGPEAAVFDKASNAELVPDRYQNTLAFMLESRYVMQPTPWALATELRQKDYINCWNGLEKKFTGRDQGAR